MVFNGSITFEGREDGMQWIKKDEETGLIDIVLETDGGGQMVLCFDPALLKSIAEKTRKFFEAGEKILKNESSGSCRIKPNLRLWIEDEDVSIQVDWEIPGENNPAIEISGKRYGTVGLGININQARVISECCRKIIEIRNSLQELEKSKIVSAKAESV